jgi:hypothetical protein
MLLLEQVGYYAGFFDGEGCVSIRYDSRCDSHILKVSIANTDRRILDELADIFGGAICGPYQKKEHHVPWYSWELQGRNAVPFLEAIRPYSRIKREQIELAFKIIETYSYKPGRGHKLPEHIKLIRKTLAEQIRNLKTKGKGLLKRAA